jgi:hypothetical protein
LPWDIGDVFAAAAERRGAEVWCLGSAFDLPHVFQSWVDAPNLFLIVPPHRLLSLCEKHRVNGARFIAVGEGVSRQLERELIYRTGIISVRRIYGHSELGTLAFQSEGTALLLRTNPRFRFSITRTSGLRIQPRSSERAVDTGDCAQLLAPLRNAKGLWASSRCLRLSARDRVVRLNGGILLPEASVEAFREEIGAELVQVAVVNPRSGIPELTVNVVRCPKFNAERLKSIFVRHVIDLCDETGLGSYREYKLRVRLCGRMDLQMTLRGKTPTIWHTNEC